MKQKLAQLFLRLLGRTLTHDQYRHSEQYQRDGQAWGAQDPDAQQRQRRATDAYNAQHRGGRYGH